MLKKSFIALIFLSHISFSIAETCPEIREIKAHQLHDWKAYTIDNGTPLSKNEMNKFITSVQQFMLAEWMDEAPEGSGHCYYEGIIPDQSFLGVFLAKQNLYPNQNSHAWEAKGRDVMQCIISINDCVFMEK